MNRPAATNQAGGAGPQTTGGQLSGGGCHHGGMAAESEVVVTGQIQQRAPQGGGQGELQRSRGGLQERLCRRRPLGPHFGIAGGQVGAQQPAPLARQGGQLCLKLPQPKAQGPESGGVQFA